MIHVESGEQTKMSKHNNSRIFRGKSPPLNSNFKNKSDQPMFTETPINTEPAAAWRPRIEHTIERTHGVLYRPKNMKRVGESDKNYKRDHYKLRKQKTAQYMITSGSGGMFGTAFSGTKPSGASEGAQFGKWSGEIIAHRNISGISSEEVKRARKEPTHLSDQTTFHMRWGKSNAKQPSMLDNNFNASFSNSDIDIMQNPEECEREHVPHQIHTSHLELSDGHSISTYMAGLSSAKCQQKRFMGDARGQNDEEVNSLVRIDNGSNRNFGCRRERLCRITSNKRIKRNTSRTKS